MLPFSAVTPKGSDTSTEGLPDSMFPIWQAGNALGIRQHEGSFNPERVRYVSVAREDLRPHRLLDQEPLPLPEHTRTTKGNACLPWRNAQRTRLPGTHCWWHDRPCSYPLHSIQELRCIRDHRQDQEKLLKMDQDKRADIIEEVCMAKRIWSVLCESIERGTRPQIHTNAGGPSSKENLSGRVQSITEIVSGRF